MSAPTWIAFLAAAGLAAPARYLVDGWIEDRAGGAFPWGTFTVNVTGCLLLGLLTGATLYHGLGPAVGTAVGTGALGAYTTFSTFTYETVRLAEDGALNEAVRNAAANLLVGLAAASVGLALMAVV